MIHTMHTCVHKFIHIYINGFLFAKGNFRLFLLSTNGQAINFHLHEEQTVNRLRKVAWASVFIFCLKWQHININIYIYTYIYVQTHTHTHVHASKKRN